MPELPEVETIKNQLNRLVAGKEIVGVKILLPKIIKLPANRFKKTVIGAKVKRLTRRAKILAIGLDNGWTMLVHLKMTGQLIYVEKTAVAVIPARFDESKTRRAKAGIQDSGSRVTSLAESRREPGMTNQRYTHVVFYFSDGSRLLFNDLRQFGYIKLVKTGELSNFFIREGTGPEPLEKDFILTDFQALLAKKPTAKIKQFLMDPKNLAGIGNIYADEILFFAGIHPLRQIKSLKETDVKKIFKGTKDILRLAIKLKGTSASDYLDAFGQPGKFAAKLKAYGRKGKKCVKCKGVIEKIKIGGRSASFCPVCQRLTP